MKIAIIGGTGSIGVGLSLRLAAASYNVIVGSRNESKAREKAEEYTSILRNFNCDANIEYAENFKASKICDVAILAVPAKHVFSTAESLRDELRGKIVISPAVPMKREKEFFVYDPPPEGSAAERIASILDDSRVISAFHTVPAKKFADMNSKFNWDVPVCGDHEDAKNVVLEIVNSIDGLRALDAGPLSSSRLVEGITPLLINLAMRNDMHNLSIKFV
ncbi:MAG: NADPH-dependent F420 reductase [Archaeoglobus sp.]|jgi:NADPH-dependent F420 reductase|nr:MAG: NADPH-dependent F420 reductase [Archaeoglobus sp.]